MRVWKDGALVLTGDDIGSDVTDIDNNGYGIDLTFTAATLAVGDEVYISGMTSNDEYAQSVNARVFQVTDISAYPVVSLRSPYANPADFDDTAALDLTGLSIRKVFRLATPYAAADLRLLKNANSADTVTLTHQSYAPSRLTRTDHDAWTLVTVPFYPKIPAPTSLTGSCYLTSASEESPNVAVAYKVTAVDAFTFEESLPAYCTFTGHTQVGQAMMEWDRSGDVDVKNPSNKTISHDLSFTRVYPSLRYNIYRSMGGSAYTFVGSCTNGDIDLVDGTEWHVQSVTRNGSDEVLIATSLAHGRAVNDLVSISGVRDDIGVLLNNRVYRVESAPTGTTLTIKDINTGDTIMFPPTYDEVEDLQFAPWVTGVLDEDAVAVISTGLTEAMYTGQKIYITNCTGADAAEVNDKYWYVRDIVTDTSITIQDSTGVAFNGTKLVLTVPTAKDISGGNCFIGYVNDPAGTQTYKDILPQSSIGLSVQDPPPAMTATNPFVSDTTYPECCAYHEQRLWFANSATKPQTVWASQIALYDNMSRKQPPAATDAVVLSLPSTQVNPVYWAVSQRNLVLFTGDGDWLIESTTSAISAATVRSQQQSYTGCSRYVRPVPVNHRILYAEDRGKGVRDMTYDDGSRGQQSIDRTIYARHFFDDYELTSMAYQSLPYSVVWATRDDGKLLAMSYEADQEVFAWSLHNHAVADARIEQVETITEGDDDYLYAVINRGTREAPNNYIERMHNRKFATLADAVFLDSCLSYDGDPTTTVYGLDHIRQPSVHVVADGAYLGEFEVSPLQSVTIPVAASKIHVGLAYEAIAETLDLEISQESVNKTTSVARVTMRVEDTVGAEYGSNEDYMTPLRDEDTTLLSGEVELNIASGWQDNGRVVMRQSKPLPATIQCVTVTTGISRS
jgi:hypothetical protein